MRLVASLLLFLAASPAWADCPLDLGHGTGVVFYSDQYMIALRPDPIRLEVGQPFALIMNVCTKASEPADIVMVEATMPEHKHGMNYAPTIKAQGEGRFRVEGMLFHMPGSWEVAFDVRPADKPTEETQRLTYDFVLK